MTTPRIAVVLSAGGLRGAAHAGVLRQLVRAGIPIHTMVGVSAGAVVAAYYAGVGLTVDELIADAEMFRGRHLLAYSLNVHCRYRFEHRLAPWCGVIPSRLRQLEAASFARLNHGVQQLGIVCHDVRAGTPRYFTKTINNGPALSDLVRASASIPFVFPAVPVACGGQEWRLTDGGVSDALPIAFASNVLGASHVIVSDCRWIAPPPRSRANTVWIRPRMATTGTLRSPRRGLLASVAAGEAAVTRDVLQTVDAWLRRAA